MLRETVAECGTEHAHSKLQQKHVFSLAVAVAKKRTPNFYVELFELDFTVLVRIIEELTNFSKEPFIALMSMTVTGQMIVIY